MKISDKITDAQTGFTVDSYAKCTFLFLVLSFLPWLIYTFKWWVHKMTIYDAMTLLSIFPSFVLSSFTPLNPRPSFLFYLVPSPLLPTSLSPHYFSTFLFLPPICLSPLLPSLFYTLGDPTCSHDGRHNIPWTWQLSNFRLKGVVAG